MEKKKLQEILSQPFVLNDWRQILTEIFGVKNFFQNPSEIILPKNNKAKAAFELGSFNTSDDRIIGLYLVKVNPDVWIEKNKVGLRELLRNVYKYDVDGALVVFEQDDKWRLSFISEIRTFDEEGNIIKQVTEPKRYTYLLGKGEKTKTPVDRIFSIAGKKLHLEDIRNAFSVETLNEEFYKIVARHFYQLVGATEGKGAKSVTYESILQLPIGKPSDNASNKVYQEFSVRLIGRTVFCWFLKVKKSDAGISLLPEHLLSSKAVKENKNYYHTILENLFFQTLNTPMSERINGLPQGSEQIPFLNGGLFEPQTEDYYKLNKITGFSEFINTIKIPDEWFISFFEYLEQYNFTIDENSVVDIEVSVDPEMLGRIFENLLAEIDPESGDTARKATGSFYTPREIVDYMATESIVHYLFNKTHIDKELLKPIFKIDNEVNFDKTDTENILDALDRLKILDPACGSGAFPMGILQKIVMALQKLDKNADWWKTRQINRIENALLRKQVKEKLEQTTVEYARKIGVIQNTLYGVDIQPIAAEISKLRCFLTLIVDENIDETKPNRGVEPLPNLEFKFVTADTLLKLPVEKDYGGLFNSNDDLNQLKQIRLDYLQSYGEHKIELKAEFKHIQGKIAKRQIESGVADVNSRAFLISSWNPFSNEKVDWFDPSWMYGIKEFDIIIANPPYKVIGADDKLIEFYKSNYKVTVGGKVNLYKLFFEKGLNLLNQNGILCYISPSNYLTSGDSYSLREFLLKESAIKEIIDYEESDRIFKSVTQAVATIITEKVKTQKNVFNYLKHKKSYSISLDNILKDDKLFIKGINPTISKIKNSGRIFDDYIYGFQGEINVSTKKKYFTDKQIIGSLPLLRGNNIGLWTLASNPIEFCPTEISNRSHHKLNRIVFQEVSNAGLQRRLKGVILSNVLCGHTTNYIFPKTENIPLRFILSLFNSKLLNFYFKFYNQTNHIPIGEIKSIPTPSLENVIYFPFVNLVDYILKLIQIGNDNAINNYTQNNHIIQLFEEVLDALVYELYFEEDFRNASIEFMKFAQRDFNSIEGKGEKEAIEIIHSAYQTLREKNNEIRQNLKLIDTRLADLIMPIKTAK